MIPYIFLLIFLITTVITFYNIQTGFSLIIAWRLIIPSMVRLGVEPGFMGTGNKGLSINSSLTLMIFVVVIFNAFKTGKLTVSTFQKGIPFIRNCGYFILGLFIIGFFSSELEILNRISGVFTLIYPEFSLAIIAWYIFKDKRAINFFYKIVCITAIGISIYGIFCYVTLTNLYITLINALYKPAQDFLVFMDEDRAGLAGRIQGTMVHPLMWGGSCMILFFFISQKQKIPQYFKVSIMILLIINIIFSGSRSSLIALFAGCITILIYSNAKTKVKYVLYSLVAFSALTTAIYQYKSLKKYQPFFESTVFFWDDSHARSQGVNGSSANMRWRQLEGSVYMINESPIFGLGPGYTRYYSITYGSHPIMRGFESIIFMALVETGFLGFALWIWFWFIIFILIIKVQRISKIPKYDKSIILLKAFTVAYIVFIIFTGLQSTLYLYLVLYVLQINYIIISANDNNLVKKSFQPEENML